jgi:type IV pilus assembly protein PilY1
VVDLTNPKNAFSSANAEITAALLGNPLVGRDAVISEVYGVDREWVLGDFVHSEPALIDYWSSDVNKNKVPDENEIESYLFAGSNGGMLHCFNDSDGNEEWGFIPPDQLDRLQFLASETHDYFVDGSPVVYDDGNRKILLFGERRGGSYYHVLEITDPLSPSYLYAIGPGHLSDVDKDGTTDLTGADLGQSWAIPEMHTIKTEIDDNPGHNIYQDVFLMTGGYDINHDTETPGENDTVGRAVFAVEVTTGEVTTLNFNGANYTEMTHSIVSASGLDANADGYLNRIYAGDLGGHLFAFRDDDYDGGWEKRKLFEIPDQITSGTAADKETIHLGKKFLEAPDVVREPFGDFIFIGTGDRAHPQNTDHTNAIYAIKHDWSDGFATLSIDANPAASDLVDVTDNLIQVGTKEQKQAVTDALEDPNKKGWFMLMANSGEKVVSSPMVFAGVVYFTTHEPSGVIDPGTDPCELSSSRGTARLYALDYNNGASAIDFNDDGTLSSTDRSEIIGTSIPSAPMIATQEGEPVILVGVEGGIRDEQPKVSSHLKVYYWRQL